MASKTFKIILAGDAKGASAAIKDAQKAGDGLISSSSSWGSKWSSVFGSMGQKLSDFGSKFGISTSGISSSMSNLSGSGGSSLGSLGDKFAGLGTAAAAGAAVAASAIVGLASVVYGKVQEIGQYLYDLGDQYFQASRKLQIGTGAQGEELAALKDSYKDVYEQTAASSTQVATVMTSLEQKLHLSGDALEGLSLQFLKFSSFTGTDMQSNLANIPRLFGDWSIAAEDQQGAMDKLFRTWQETGVDLSQLETNLVKFGGPLRQLGFDFDSSTALIAKFQNEGVNTELVLGSMRVSLGRMARANADVADSQDQLTYAQAAYTKAIEEHGEGSIEAEKAANRIADAEAKLAKGMAGADVAGMFRDQLEAIKNAGSTGEANAAALELFGAKAGPDMAAAVREGRFEIDDLVGVIAGSEGAMSSAADGVGDWRVSLTKLVHLFENRLEPAATAVFGTINTVLRDNVIPLFAGLAKAWDEGGFEGAVAQLPVMLGLVQVKLSEWWETFKGWLGDHAPEIMEGIGSAIRASIQAGGALATALADMLMAFGNWFQDTAFPYVEEHWGEWWKSFTDSFNEGGFMNQALSKLAEFLATLGAWIFSDALPWATEKGLQIMFALWEWLLTQGAPTAIAGLGTMFGAIVEWIETDGASWIADGARGLWDGIVNTFVDAVNAIIGIWNGLSFDVPSIDAFGVTIGGQTVNTPDIPVINTGNTAAPSTTGVAAGGVKRFAMGGVVTRPTLGIIGEDSRTTPEIVSPVELMRQVVREELRGAGGGQTLVQLVLKDGRVLADVTIDALRTQGMSIR